MARKRSRADVPGRMPRVPEPSASPARPASGPASYLTVRTGTEAVGELVDRKSRFIAQIVHIESEAEAQDHLARSRARHYDARHHVPAWILADGTERASDDGEPQRTSGMPTLEVLRGAGLRDVSCVTTRYFGGTLLGPGGLVRAYSGAAQAAIERAREAGLIVEMTLVTTVRATVPYARFEQAQRLAAACGGKEAGNEFADAVTMLVAFRSGDESAFAADLTELLGGSFPMEVGRPSFAEF